MKLFIDSDKFLDIKTNFLVITTYFSDFGNVLLYFLLDLVLCNYEPLMRRLGNQTS